MNKGVEFKYFKWRIVFKCAECWISISYFGNDRQWDLYIIKVNLGSSINEQPINFLSNYISFI